MSDSWETFAEVLSQESATMSRLHRAAVALTKALVAGEPHEILERTQCVETERKVHAAAASSRRIMQRRGFGKMTLREVCSYSPRVLSHHFCARLSELAYYASSLRITNDNNKALIVAGMERLLKVVDVLQRAASEQTGTYRRRGLQRKRDASVIMSQRA